MPHLFRSLRKRNFRLLVLQISCKPRRFRRALSVTRRSQHYFIVTMSSMAPGVGTS
jgi:hypothetical protein